MDERQRILAECAQAAPQPATAASARSRCFGPLDAEGGRSKLRASGEGSLRAAEAYKALPCASFEALARRETPACSRYESTQRMTCTQPSARHLAVTSSS